MKNFEYAAANSLDEAVSLLAARGERAKILAGGTDILVQLREGQCDADLVVDVKKIPELMQLEYDPQRGLRLGAAVPCFHIYSDPLVSAAYPALVDAAHIIGGWQIQSRACVGGNLCNASPAADTVPPLLAYEAICHLAGPDGRRTIAAKDFCTGPRKNVLKRGEMLVTIEFPPPVPKSSAAYQRFIPRNEMDIAVAGAASWAQLDASGQNIEAARIALAAVAPTPVLADEAGQWLAAKPATEETYAEAGERARSVASPIDDMRGTAEYRTHLVGVLVKRTLMLAVERARASA